MQDTLDTGLPYRNVPAYEFNQLMADRADAILLDVRTPGEIRQQSLNADLSLDFNSPDFSAQVARLDKDKTYLVYCRSGNRSGQACELMNQQGFTKLYNLVGGLMNWPY